MTELTKAEHIALALTSALVGGALKNTLSKGTGDEENQALISRTVEVYETVFKMILHDLQKPQT